MITFKTLDLKDFMCAKDAHLDFTDKKVILLSGDNGNGKSLILDAISLCLTGYKRGSGYGDYIRWHADEAHIVLTGEAKGFPITFDVIVQKKGLTRTLKYIREQAYVGSEVDAVLKEIGIKEHTDLILSRQGDDDEIIKATPGKRVEYLQNLLNRTYFEEANFAKTKLTEAKTQATRCNDVITLNNSTINIKKAQIKPIPEDDVSDKITNLTTAMNTVKAELTKYVGIPEKQAELTNKLNGILQSKYALSTKIANLESSINQLPTMKETLNNYNTSLAKLTETITSNLSNTTQLNNSLLKINEELKTLENKRSEVITELATAKADLATIQKHINLIDMGKCPECGHEFSEGDKAVYEKALNETNQKIATLETSQTSLINDINQKKDLYNKTSADVTNATNEVNLLNNEINNIQINKPKLEEQVSYIENIATGELSKNKNELAELEKSETAIKLEQNDLAESLKTYETLNADLQNAQQQINVLSQQRLNRENIITQNNNITTEIDSLQKSIEEQTSLIEESHKEEAVYKEVSSLVDELQDFAIIKSCEKLEHEINDFIKIIFPSMYVKLFQNKTGVEFFYTKDLTEDTPIESLKKEDLSNAKMASGFERAALSMAFKVVLCRAYGLSFAFFDEADEKGSEVNSVNLFKSLIDANIFKQIFIISQKSIVKDTLQSEMEDVCTYQVHKGNFTLEGNY